MTTNVADKTAFNSSCRLINLGLHYHFSRGSDQCRSRYPPTTSDPEKHLHRRLSILINPALTSLFRRAQTSWCPRFARCWLTWGSFLAWCPTSAVVSRCGILICQVPGAPGSAPLACGSSALECRSKRHRSQRLYLLAWCPTFARFWLKRGVVSCWCPTSVAVSRCGTLISIHWRAVQRAPGAPGSAPRSSALTWGRSALECRSKRHRSQRLYLLAWCPTFARFWLTWGSFLLPQVRPSRVILSQAKDLPPVPHICCSWQMWDSDFDSLMGAPGSPESGSPARLGSLG
jgi:hypothetical protein